jgi:hypothetical protein
VARSDTVNISTAENYNVDATFIYHNPGLYCEFSRIMNPFVFSIRNIVLFDGSEYSPREFLYDFGFLVGYRVRREYQGKEHFVSASAGLGSVFGVRRGNYLYNTNGFEQHYEKKKMITIGVPLSVNIYRYMNKHLGLGLGLIGNINLERIYFGGLFLFKYRI